MDCSVTMGWCFEDEKDDSSEVMLDLLVTWGAAVPSIWSFEVANILLVGERRKRITKLDSSNFLSFLSALPVTVDDSSTERALGPILVLAREQGLSAYDAAYLELAMREGLPLATRDKALRRAAVLLGISIVSK